MAQGNIGMRFELRHPLRGGTDDGFRMGVSSGDYIACTPGAPLPKRKPTGLAETDADRSGPRTVKILTGCSVGEAVRSWVYVN